MLPGARLQAAPDLAADAEQSAAADGGGHLSFLEFAEGEMEPTIRRGRRWLVAGVATLLVLLVTSRLAVVVREPAATVGVAAAAAWTSNSDARGTSSDGGRRRRLVRREGSFNSATTVRSWKTKNRPRGSPRYTRLQFGHDGEVVEN